MDKEKSERPVKDRQIDAEVLNFYKSLPFNHYQSAQMQADKIRTQNALLDRPPLLPLLTTGTQILDVGCGTGWLSHSIAYHYGLETLGIDFNPTAIQRARETARLLDVSAHFEVEDVFTFSPQQQFPLVCSEGVLHHTSDCHAAIAHLIQHCVQAGGYLYLGLYHRYGRAPFLQHFAKLQDSGADEATLLRRFSELLGSTSDDTHLYSWFRDQVLHPHETQHTLEELVPLLRDGGCTLVSTSVNHFKPIRSLSTLFELERALGETAKQRLAQGQYYPGFFVLLAQKTTKN